jgi:sulfate permease, SulP family
LALKLNRYLGCLEWAVGYRRSDLTADFLAAIIVTIMLIPQSLAYALLAGLPPEAGLYASILPLIAYAIFGSSRTLSVGPVAVISLMTAVAIGRVVETGSIGALEAAVALATLSGLMLIVMGLLGLGFLANFLSHPVISGFISASGILIAASQLKHILGISVSGHNLFELASALAANLTQTNLPTLILGTTVLVFLFWSRKGLKPLLVKLGLKEPQAALWARTGPVWAVIASTLAVSLFGLDRMGVNTLGDVPAGLPSLALPSFDVDLWAALATSALLISVVGFVESISVAQTLAAKRRQRVDANKEMLGLGAANLGAAVSGAFPVTGGFSRSVVNFDAGAVTPAAGIYTAIGIALATLFLTPLIKMLPIATLAATIIVAVISLIDLGALGRTFSYSKADFSAMAATIVLTLVSGVELGILVGVGLSLFLFLYRTSKPHSAVVGRVPGTEHFRNINRHKVITSDHLLSLRVDASLYFANARFLENCILSKVAEQPALTDLVLMCTAINDIDASALESLEAINERLAESGVKFHLSEVKGPVMDKLQRTEFLDALTGQIFLTQFQAVAALAPETIQEKNL